MKVDVVSELGVELTHAIDATYRAAVRDYTVIPKWIERMDAVCTKLFGEKAHERDGFAKQLAESTCERSVLDYVKWSITMGILSDIKGILEPLRTIDPKLTEKLLNSNEEILVAYRKVLENAERAFVNVVLDPEIRIRTRDLLVEAVLSSREYAHSRNGANAFFVTCATINFLAAENSARCPAEILELAASVSFKDAYKKYIEALNVILKSEDKDAR